MSLPEPAPTAPRERDEPMRPDEDQAVGVPAEETALTAGPLEADPPLASTAATVPGNRPSIGLAHPPRAHRTGEGAWLAGVASGIADHLGWPVLLVRAGFVALAIMQGIGIVVYGLLWVLMPPAGAEPRPQAPGLEAAEHTGMRRRRPAAALVRRDAGAVLTLALLGSGIALLAQRFGVGPSAAFFWPLAFAAVGVALVWRQADRPTPSPDELPDGWLGRFLARGGWAAMLRTGVGLGLVGVSVSMVAASQIGVAQLPLMLGLAGLMLLGFAIAVAPWIARLRRSAQAAHERALLDQARADMAAHLHDSVLQTLALIQRQADDPKAVAALARRQERELRAWLYGDQPVDGSLKAALTRVAGEIEDERDIEVELVCVGDAPLDERTTAVVRAAREAMMNSAKHSGTSRVDVYCEVEPGVVEVFVRDRGAGFEMAAIGDDRMGVRRSIVERMERHGGAARIRSAPGEGTEVRLAMEI